MAFDVAGSCRSTGTEGWARFAGEDSRRKFPVIRFSSLRMTKAILRAGSARNSRAEFAFRAVSSLVRLNLRRTLKVRFYETASGCSYAIDLSPTRGIGKKKAGSGYPSMAICS